MEKKLETKGLRVIGKSFCAGAVFEKVNGEWRIKWIAPYLKKIIGNTPTRDIGRLLKSKGCTYEWSD